MYHCNSMQYLFISPLRAALRLFLQRATTYTSWLKARLGHEICIESTPVLTLDSLIASILLGPKCFDTGWRQRLAVVRDFAIVCHRRHRRRVRSTSSPGKAFPSISTASHLVLFRQITLQNHSLSSWAKLGSLPAQANPTVGLRIGGYSCACSAHLDP